MRTAAAGVNRERGPQYRPWKRIVNAGPKLNSYRRSNLELGEDAGGKRLRSAPTFHGTKREAEEEVTRLPRKLHTGTYVDGKHSANPCRAGMATLRADQARGAQAGALRMRR